jgi:hypothetical protein
MYVGLGILFYTKSTLLFQISVEKAQENCNSTSMKPLNFPKRERSRKRPHRNFKYRDYVEATLAECFVFYGVDNIGKDISGKRYRDYMRAIQ